MLSGLSAEGASVAGFSVNDEVTIQDLIYGALLPSGADACRALAFQIAGNEEAFADMMNQKALSLGLKNTHFMNTTGLHNNGHYTTVKEMAVIMKSAIQNPTIYTAMTSERYVTIPTPLHPEGLELSSTLKTQERRANLKNSITGGKTGFTLEGGLCLASFVKNEKGSYLMVSGHAGIDSSYPQHIIDAHTVYEYMLATYEYKEILPSNSEIVSIKVKYNFFQNKISVKKEDAISALVNQSYDTSKVTVNFDGPLTIEAPVQEGQLLGNVRIEYEGELIKQIPYYADHDIDRNVLLYSLAMIVDFIVAMRYGLLVLLLMLVIWIAYCRYKVLKRRKQRQQRKRK